jgi:hypothetical protein
MTEEDLDQQSSKAFRKSLEDHFGLKGLFLTNHEKITDRGLLNLTHLTSLTALGITGDFSKITGAGILQFSHLSFLEFLRIGCDRKFYNDDLVNLPKLRSLKILDLTQCSWATDKDLIPFLQISSLKYLGIPSVSVGVTQIGIAKLKNYIKVVFGPLYEPSNPDDIYFNNLLKKFFLSACTERLLY